MKTVMIEGFVNYDNVENLCTADHADLAVNSTAGGNCAYEMYMSGRDGTVWINETGRAYMYPTPTARPYQIETQFTAERFAVTADQTLYIGGEAVWNQDIDHASETVYASGILTGDAISNSTRESELRWDIHVGSEVIVVAIREFRFKFYYYQYEHQALKSKDARGVDGVKVLLAHVGEYADTVEPYHGDYVVYSATLNEKSRWKGWYADPEHTQLVSTDVNYVVEANSDLVLYAYATKRQDVDFNVDNEWKEGIVVWEKIGGVWTEITKSQIKTDVGYEINRGD